MIKLTLPEIANGEDKSSDLANRIRKNYRHVRKWARRTGTDCFRIYGRDIKEFPVAIDFYAGRFCVQYFSSRSDDEEIPSKYKDEIIKALRSVFGAEEDLIYWRTRAKYKETRQYEKLEETKEFFPVFEYGVKFLINLSDYLDTGLFLDHRETRQMVASMSKGKRVLNLFAYTCSFSVHAALAGATFTKSVDMSNTYCLWGRNNFNLNSLPAQNNPIERADCLKFLNEEIRSKTTYDIVVIDPPTISRSKKMEDLFDIQIDYLSLIEKALPLLSKDGVIFFSTNSRKFLFNTAYFKNCTIQDISSKTIPLDFHSSKIHRCWKIKLAEV